MSQPYGSYESLLIALYPLLREAYSLHSWPQDSPAQPSGRVGDDKFFFSVGVSGGGADPWGGGESWEGVTFTSPEGVLLDCGYHDISLAGRYYHYKSAFSDQELALKILRIATQVLYRREPSESELRNRTINE